MPCVLCLSFQQKFNVSTGTIVIPIMDEFQEKSKKFSCKHSHYQRPPTSWFHIVEWQIFDNGSTVLLHQPHYQTTNASHRWLSPIAILCAWSFSYSIGCFVICGVSQFVCNASSQCNAMRIITPEHCSAHCVQWTQFPKSIQHLGRWQPPSPR